MLSEFIDKIVGLAEPKVFDYKGETFSDKKVFKLRAKETPSLIFLRTLTSVVDYCYNNLDNETEHVIWIDKKEITITGAMEPDNIRNYYIRAKSDTFDFDFNEYYDQERFMIKMLTQFEKNEDMEKLLTLVSKVKDENTTEYSDNGMTQNVKVNMGIKIEDVKIPNPFLLIPKDSFSELETFESPYVLRIKKQQGSPTYALFGADDGQRMLKNTQLIKEFLTETLKELVKEKKVFILG